MKKSKTKLNSFSEEDDNSRGGAAFKEDNRESRGRAAFKEDNREQRRWFVAFRPDNKEVPTLKRSMYLKHDIRHPSPHSVVCMRNVPNRFMHLNTWSTSWWCCLGEVLEPVGGSSLLEEVCHLGGL